MVSVGASGFLWQQFTSLIEEICDRKRSNFRLKTQFHKQIFFLEVSLVDNINEKELDGKNLFSHRSCFIIKWKWSNWVVFFSYCISSLREIVPIGFFSADRLSLHWRINVFWERDIAIRYQSLLRNARFDINKIKKNLLAVLLNERDFEPIVIRTAKQFAPFKFDDVQLFEFLKLFGVAIKTHALPKAY